MKKRTKGNHETQKPLNKTQPTNPNQTNPRSCVSKGRPITTDTDQKPLTITRQKHHETKPSTTSKPNVKTRTEVDGVSDIESLKKFLAKKKLDREQKQMQAKSGRAEASAHTASPGSLRSVLNQKTANRPTCGENSSDTKPNEITLELNRRGKRKLI